MARDIPIGNGTTLAAFDFDYRIREFHFPRVGKENHALGHPWRLGVWADGRFAWVAREGWSLWRGYLTDALVTDVHLAHPALAVRLACNDLIDFEHDLLLRRVRVTSLAEQAREVRLFFHCDLNVMENATGDTVFYDPRNACLVHYKGPRYFLMGCATERELGVTHFATGRKRQPGFAGTWVDAEDGRLGGNPIAQGAVDSVVGVHLWVEPGGEAVCWYWLAAGRSYREVEALHHYVTDMASPDSLVERNVNYWRHWLSPRREDLAPLPPAWGEAYRRSLLVMRTQIDRGGAVIAANDSDTWQFNQDTYSYMWPRDGALVCHALDRAGFSGISRRFLEFCTGRAPQYNYSAGLLAESGFLMHKYNPDGSVGSSWHPWVVGDDVRLPIQEDETALVVWAIWQHYAARRDIDEVRAYYWPFTVHAADFLLAFRDEHSGLPLPSYDLWEERRGVFTYTAATVVAGLEAAANLAELFRECERARRYRAGAAAVGAAIGEHLFDRDRGRFLRGLVVDGEGLVADPTLDASLLLAALLGVLPPTDPRMRATAAAIEERLWVGGPIGGLSRYEGDSYHAGGGGANPWVICTLWLAQYHMAAATAPAHWQRARDLIDWTLSRALPSGVLPEQLDPRSGEFRSVSPLTWSHAALVGALLDYAERGQP